MALMISIFVSLALTTYGISDIKNRRHWGWFVAGLTVPAFALCLLLSLSTRPRLDPVLARAIALARDAPPRPSSPVGAWP